MQMLLLPVPRRRDEELFKKRTKRSKKLKRVDSTDVAGSRYS